MIRRCLLALAIFVTALGAGAQPAASSGNMCDWDFLRPSAGEGSGSCGGQPCLTPLEAERTLIENLDFLCRELTLEDLPTAEVTTTLCLVPDGAGGVVWDACPGAGAGLTVEEADGAPTVGSVSRIQFDQEDGFTVVDETGGQAQVAFALPADSVTAAMVADGDHGQVSYAGNVATVEGIQGGASFPVSPAVDDVFAMTDDGSAGACDAGGAGAQTLCRWTGSAWAALGDGGGGVVAGGDGETIAAAVELTANESIPNNALTAVPWDVEDYDLGDFWDAGSPTRLTVPAGGGGMYHVSCSAEFASSSGGTRVWEIWLNGSRGALRYALPTPGSTATPAMAIQGVLNLAGGDYVECVVYQNSGGALNLSYAAAVAGVNRFSVTKILGGADGSGARASRSTTQAIASATWTAITMDAEAWDDGNVFDLGTQPTRLTVPTGSDGRWLVVGEANWSATATGGTGVEAAVWKNGSEVAAVRAEDFASSGRQVSAVVDAVAGDHFELAVRQDSGVSDDVTSAWVAAWCLSCGPGDSSGAAAAAEDAVLVRVEKNASQSIAANSTAVLTWQTEIDDDDGFRDPGTPNRLVVPAGFAGVYTVGCMASHATTTDAVMGAVLEITVNGVPEGRGVDRTPIAAAGTVSATTAVNLAAGDYIECEFGHDDSAALDVLQCGGNNCTTGAPTQLWMVGR